MEAETWLLIGAALVGIVVGLLHLVGYVPPRYRRMLRDIQAQTADALGAAVKATGTRFDLQPVVNGLQRVEAALTNSMDLPDKIQAGLHAELQEAANGLRSGMESLQAQLSSFQELPAGVAQAVGQSLSQVLSSVGASAIQPAATEARQLNSFAKVGAKKLALAAAGGFHPVAGVGLGLANAIGLVDDSDLEKMAEFLIDNPDLMARLNAAGRMIQERRGILPEATTDWNPGLGR